MAELRILAELAVEEEKPTASELELRFQREEAPVTVMELLLELAVEPMMTAWVALILRRAPSWMVTELLEELEVEPRRRSLLVTNHWELGPVMVTELLLLLRSERSLEPPPE